MNRSQPNLPKPNIKTAGSPRILILADDLSSATDCGVQMASGGYRVAVPLNPERVAGINAEILSLDIDSRMLKSEQAYIATRAAIDALGPASEVVFYKSVDSTLRGNLGAEIAACLDTGRFKAAIIAPAFPTYGRTTWHGIQHLHGVPVSATEFGSDPGTPVRTSVIAERIAEQCAYKAETVPLSVLRQDGSAVCRTVEDNLRRGIALFVFDALEESDLERIAMTASRLPHPLLWVGSTGLSRYLPKALDLPRQTIATTVPVSDGIVLIVAGSASEVTRRQIDAYAGRPDFTEVQLDAKAIAQGGEPERAELSRVGRALQAATKAGSGPVALTLRASRGDIARTKELALDRGMTGPEISQYLADTLARLTAGLLDQGAAVKGLVLTGGATAKTVASACAAEAISIIEEVSPGIPLAAMSGRHALLLVIKAGGFGDAETLIKSAEKIRHYGRA